MIDFVAAKLIDFAPYVAKIGDACTPARKNTFLGLPNWWKYLGGERDGLGTCTPTVNLSQRGFTDIWAIVLAVIDILLRLAGIAAVILIIYAGVSYIVSQGNSEKTTAARKRITNSLIGLGIVLISAAVVSFIGNRLG